MSEQLNRDGRTHFTGCATVHIECARADLARKVLIEVKREMSRARQATPRSIYARLVNLFTREGIEIEANEVRSKS